MRVNRLSEIEGYVRRNLRASTGELCDYFNISLNTLRRDINELVKRGVISKVYGGVVISQENEVVPLHERKGINREEKAIIGSLASNLVESGETIYVDSGTTAFSILPHLKNKSQITVLSNSQLVFSNAFKYPNLQFISPGGLYNPETNSFVGSSTISKLKSFRFTKAFMSSTAFNLQGSAMNNSYHESEIKKAVIECAKEIVLMLDYTKIDQQAAISFCPLERINYFICDKALPKEYMSLLKENGITIIIK